MYKIKLNSQIYNYITLPIKHQEALEVYVSPLNKEEKTLTFKPSDSIEITTPRTPEARHIKLLFYIMDFYANLYTGTPINEICVKWSQLRNVYKYTSKAQGQEHILGAINDLINTEIICYSNSKAYSLKFIDNFNVNQKEVSIVLNTSFINVLSPPKATSKAKKKQIAVKFLPSELMEVSSKNVMKFNLLCYMLIQKKPKAKESTLLNIINKKAYKRSNGKAYFRNGINNALKQLENILEFEEVENKQGEKLYKWKYRGESCKK